MGRFIKTITLSALTFVCCNNQMVASMSNINNDNFEYANERFADLQMLRYKVEGFNNLTLKQKTLIYHLSEAALYGRDILFDQNGKYNLRIRQILEDIYLSKNVDRQSDDFKAMEIYLKRVWFSNGIHHHYGCDKFIPGFSESWFRSAWDKCKSKEHAESINIDEICNIIFNPEIMPKRVSLSGKDLVKASACNYYENVTQEEAEKYYNTLKAQGNPERPVMYGMNSRLAKDKNGNIIEKKWTASTMYGSAINKIIEHLKLARPFVEDEQQGKVLDKLIDYYITGDLKTFDEYSILWVENTEPLVDFVNGFIECYGDPLGLKCSWESIVNFKDVEATKRTETLSKNAQWFEDHSPVDEKFKKENVKGISAKVINAAILAGDLYPATAIGINLPNSDWVRKEHGSKSVTIGNLTSAYSKAAGNGMRKEFCFSQEEVDLIEKYGDTTDDLHTDLHECLGHGSGKLLPGVDGDSLKEYGSTIEEARADLFALYYLADPKLIELGLVPDDIAYRSEYYTYMMNGYMTQLVRIELGKDIEEAHMRNRALIANWVMDHSDCKNDTPVVSVIHREGKTYIKVNDYTQLRNLFGELLAEIQRIKSEGDYRAAKNLVEKYGVKIDKTLHQEVLERYNKLNLAPYKGFINPVYKPTYDKDGNITDITIDYTESYTNQMLRYSHDYRTLPLINE